jgi:sulfur carrier protein
MGKLLWDQAPAIRQRTVQWFHQRRQSHAAPRHALSPEARPGAWIGDGWRRLAARNRCIGDNGGMNIQLNGQARTLAPGATVQDLLQHEQLLERRVAVEVNSEIITRSLHATHVLADGDVVEIVHALGGG